MTFKLKSIVLAILLLFSAVTFGGSVEPATARKVATNWYRNYAPTSKQLAIVTKVKEYKWGDRTSFYICSFDKGGFVLVSANDAVTPVLGYGFDHGIPDSITNEAVKGWFDGYARQIDTAFVLNMKSDEAAAKWNDVLMNNFPKLPGDTVEPLLTTTWGQGWPYNGLCPSNSWGHAVVGCTATAYAQVLKYWNYPKNGNGIHSYTDPDYGVITANFGATTYDWNNMPDNITEYNDAVATLNFHCGVAIDMDYGPFSSGAYISGIPGASVNYFGYESTINEVSYLGNLVLWKTNIKNQLQLLQPIIYTGYDASFSVGHAYVIDGYNADYFHINFGWNGSSDGYYLLTPSSSVTPYQFGPSAIVDIRPDLRIYTFNANDIDSTSAKFVSSVNPGNDYLYTAKYYIWLNEQIPATIVDATPTSVTGNQPIIVRNVVQGLLPNSNYSFCLRIENESYSYTGDTLAFSTESSAYLGQYSANIYYDTIYICSGQSWKGRTAGDYSDTTWFNNSNVISYIINTNVIENSISPIINVTATPDTACKGSIVILQVSGADSYTWSHDLIPSDSIGLVATINTTYTVTGQFNGCNSSESINIYVNPTYLNETNITLGVEDAYNWRNQILSNAGIYYDSLQTINGCDSVFQLNLKKPVFSGGNGSSASPYLISTKADLEELADALINENNWSLNKYFRVINSINDPIYTIIGSSDYPFEGHFQGGGYSVELQMFYPDKDIVGLFGVISTDAIIDSLKTTGVVIGSNNVGGVCGINQGKIFYCSNEALVTGQDFIGGISGSYAPPESGNIIGTGIVKYSSNSGSISGNGTVGGISGSGNCSYCINIGDVSGSWVWVGGITGFGNCNYCFNAGTISGMNQVGGISGYLDSKQSIHVGEIICPYSYVGVTGYGSTDSCYYDWQLCTKWIKNIANQTTGKCTVDLVGTSLETVLDTNFIYQSNMYPIPKGMENDPIAILAATPVFFDPIDTRITIARPFEVNSSHQVIWSSAQNKVTFFPNDSVQQNIHGNDTLLATLEGVTKKIPISIICVYTPGKLYLSDCDSVSYNDMVHTRDTLFNATIQSTSGSDSLITVIIDIQTTLTQIQDSIAINGTYNFNGQILTRKGIYYDTLQTVTGCDSIIQLNLLGSPFSGGSGVEMEPYLISCRQDMYELSDNVIRYGDEWTSGKHFRLINDITDSVRMMINNFSGFFYGGGHTIVVSINENSDDYSQPYIALFRFNSSVIDSVIIRGKVNATGTCPRTGGLVGNNDGNGRISNCINYADINGVYSGGICGSMMNGGLVVKCENYGNISGRDYAGGIAAEVYNGNFYLCQNSGTVLAPVCGGICATVSLSVNYIGYCVNTGTVKGHNAGGIAGESSGNEIIACSNAGTVMQTCHHIAHGAGGICGVNNGIISNCINVGEIVGENVNNNVGVITGLNNNEDLYISNCYFDNQVSGGINNNLITPLNTQEMIGGQLLFNSSLFNASPDLSLINAGWTYSPTLYPRPSIADMAYTSTAIVAATPLFLDPTNTVNTITLPFSVGVDNNVIWHSVNNKVLIDNITGNVQLLQTGTDSLIATLDHSQKMIVINVTQIPDTVVVMTFEDCHEVLYKNVSYKNSIQLNEVYQNVSGGDSVVNIMIKIHDYLSEFSTSIHEGENYIFRGQVLTESGIYYDSLVTMNGCDSVYKLTLNVISDQGNIYVSPNGQGNGISWNTATSSLQDAISIAALYTPKRDVWVAAGTYFGDGIPDHDAFMVNWGVKVFGGFFGDEPEDYDLSQRDFENNRTILDGQNIQRVVNCDYSWQYPYWYGAQNTVLDGFTIQNGYSAFSGGGIVIGDRSQSITNCVIRNNFAGNLGGGVYGNGTLINSIVTGNHATSGGGVYSGIIINSTIVGNSANQIGGVKGGELINSVLWNNTNGQLSEGSAIYSAIEGGFSGEGNINIATENEGDDDNMNYIRFVDPESQIFILKENSACIDMGKIDLTGLDIPLVDITGNLRIQNNRIDIGSCEYGCILTRTIVDTAYLTMGGSYPFYSSNILQSGTYMHKWQISESCDSLVILKLVIIPTCPKPTNLTSSNETLTTVEIDWSESGNASVWSIEYGYAGFNRGCGTNLTASYHPYTLVGLIQNEAYDVYIQSECSIGDSSESGKITFHTLPSCPAPSNISVSAVSDSAVVSWTEEGCSTIWNIEFGLAGFILGTGTSLQVTSNPFTINGLLPHTLYHVYVQSDCGDGDVSEWTLSSFYTNTYIYVTTSGAGIQDGSSWENATSGLQQAIYAAQTSGSLIWVAQGTYYGDSFADYAFQVPAGVTIYGGFTGSEPVTFDLSQRDYKANASILDGQNINSVVQSLGVLNGFTIQHGESTDGVGGFYSGAYNYEGGLGGKLVNCIIQNNNGYQGGGASGGTLINCILQNNTASMMGGGAAWSTLTNSTVVNNIANSYAGGVYAGTLTNCIFWGNNNQQILHAIVTNCAVESGYEGETNINLASENTGNNPDLNYVRFKNPSTGVDYNWQLSDGSVCIDNGKYTLTGLEIPSFDLAGNSRIQNGYIDIGAYEYQTPPINYQEIALTQGWNIFSAYVIPINDNMLSALNSLIDSSELIKVVDETGGFIQNIPGIGWMNTIGDMENTEGYYLKATENSCLTIVGAEISLPFEIPLQTGWNIMGYPVQTSQDAITTLQPLIDNGSLVKVINESGGFIQNIPGLGWLNTIGNFEPGEGFYIKQSANDTLVLYEPIVRGSEQLAYLKEGIYFMRKSIGNPYLPMHIVAKFSEEIELETEDELGVFIHDECIGSGVITDPAAPVVVFLSTDDPSTDIIDGGLVGDIMQFKLLHLGQEFELQPQELVRYEPLETKLVNFAANGLDVSAPIETDFVVSEVIPNPFSSEAKIYVMIPETGKLKIEVLDLRGVVIKSLFEKSVESQKLEIKIEGDELKQGMYFIHVRFSHDGVVKDVLRKVVVRSK